MKNALRVIVTLGILVSACGKKDYSHSKGEISGTYVREYSFKVINPETGAEIGMRTIRDTIFIRPVEEKYEISNNKWRLNDYDKEGWQNMQHSEDRPMPSFAAKYNNSTGAIIGVSMPLLYTDPNKKFLWNVGKLGINYKRID